MTVISSNTLTDFVNLQLTKSSSCLTYAAGGTFEGNIKDNQACGYGKFTWPDDEFFEGFYQNGLRNKIGFQKWSDGDTYKGEYFNDKKHGWGIYKWANNDIYEGSFYQDCRHGFGVYSSNKTRFVGTFYMNKREGFGTYYFENGDVFQGLYKDNYRCGPGVLHYANGRQDIGLWHRSSLLKSIVHQSEVFTNQQFSDLISLYSNTDTETLSLSQSDSISSNFHLPYDHILRYKLKKPAIIAVLENEIEDKTTLRVGFKDDLQDKETYDCAVDIPATTQNQNEDSFGDNEEGPSLHSDDKIPDEMDPVPNIEVEYTIELVEKENVSDPHLDELRKEYLSVDINFTEFFSNLTKSVNIPPFMRMFMVHLARFSTQIPITVIENLTCDLATVVKDVVSNIFSNLKPDIYVDRKLKYNPPGYFEEQSELLLSLSHSGDLEEIKRLLTEPLPPNVNVTDCKGSFSLLEATLTWNSELINYLLDCGANINQVTDEGISALGACMFYYYPQKYFIETIAETVVQLKQTPFNYNGVRREPTNKPTLLETEELNKSNKDILQTVKSLKKLDIQETKDETVSLDDNDKDWNDYQKSSINMDFQNNNLLNPINNSKSDLSTKPLIKKLKDENSNKFDSYRNNIGFPIKISGNLLEKAASILSTNSMLISRQPRPNSCYQELSNTEGIARYRALQISRCNQMLQVIQLLLRRGANPNTCNIPFPALFFAIKSGDIDMAKLLITKGADFNATLKSQNGSLSLLHISSCLPGKFGVMITELLLCSGAEPNVRALEDESFLDKTLIDEWKKDTLSEEQLNLIGGKTPLHLACSRYDDFKVSHAITKLLLDYGADPNLLCNGHTPLTLAVASGNDLIVDEILKNDKLDINLPLTNGLGTILCVASSTSFEHTRTIESRLNLVKKLIAANANLLAPVPVGSKRIQGIVIDYAYHVFNLDQRVAHLPYHALTSVERDLFNNRRAMLSHVGMFTRECAVEKEKERLEITKEEGIEERTPSPDFIYTGAGAVPDTSSVISKSVRQMINLESQMQGAELLARKPLLKYCYECGRSVNVKLTACTRCREVYFCSKLCKTKAWTSRHKSECLRVGARVSSAGSIDKKNRNVDSPTPATEAEDPKISKEAAKFSKQQLIKKDPSQLKEKLNQDSQQSHQVIKQNNLPRRLPPLSSNEHPSYSYVYIMGQYVKVDNSGKLILIGQGYMDNYSFE